jgi:bifunctional non-homologous end joining protein LigD
VSTPLEWREVNDKLDASDFTIETIRKQIEKKGDLWKDILNKKTIHSIVKF